MIAVTKERMYKRRICASLLVTGLLNGCNLAPAYKRPVQPVQNSWPQDAGITRLTSSNSIATLGWDKFFVDPRLKALIELALRNNRDLRSQAAAIIEAQGQYEVQHASLFPSISTTGSGMYVAPSSTGGFSFAPGQGESISTLRYYSLGIGFSSYEIDLFGRIRNLSKQEAEAALASDYNARSVLISTVSQIATTYIQWLADRELLQLATDTLTSESKTLRLTQLQYDHGESDLLTLSQNQTQVEQAGSDKEQATRQLAEDEHELQLLVGAPMSTSLPQPAALGQQTILVDLPAGLPTDLIANRPDIQAAEHKLIGANANIGAARAAFFPRVTLTANEGVSSLEFRRLFTPGAETWALSPSISLPIFTWGQNEGNLRIAKARKLEEVATYEKTVQTAFKEVSDGLTARETYLVQGQRMTTLVASSRRAYDLSMMRFSTGSISYLTALVQQRSLYQAQRSLIEVDMARNQNLVTLYRALGGGWSQTMGKG